MSDIPRYYKESGKIGFLGLIGMPAVGIVTSAVLGFIYAYASYYIGVVYLNVILAFAFGFGLGYVAGKVAYWGKVRNKYFWIIMSGLLGFVASYFGWVFWIFALSEQSILVFDPVQIYQFMQEIAAEGSWSIVGITPRGGMLGMIWMLEIGVIVLMTYFGLDLAFGKQIFCENCHTWTHATVLTSYLEPIYDTYKFRVALEEGDFSVLTDLKRVSHTAENRAKVQIFKCPNCLESNFLRVDAIEATITEKGLINQKEELILENLIIPIEAYESISQWGEALKAES
ncbi:MAG: hypothetical protein AAFQ87_21390 [Bacteroidota bacterium]